MKTSYTPVNSEDNTVEVRGIRFPVDLIRAMMLETSGILVTDDNVMSALDRGMAAHFADKGDDADLPDSLLIEAIPAMRFVPWRIKLHGTMPGSPFWDELGMRTNVCLYFAARRIFHA